MAENSGDLAMGYMMGQSDGNGNCNNGGGSGYGGMNDWMGLAMFALIFGRNGNGLFGNNNDGGCATQADVRAAVDQQTLISKIDQQTYGISDTFTALNNTLNNNFRGIDNAICTLGYQNQAGVSSLSAQMAKCCCDIERGIDGVNYNMASHFCNLGNTIQSTTRDIIDNQNANYRGLMDFLVQEKLSSKDAKIAELTNQLSQSNQNAVIGARIDAAVAEVLRRTGNDCPTAAYLVQPPTPVNFPLNNCGTVQFGGGNGCGCGCG